MSFGKIRFAAVPAFLLALVACGGSSGSSEDPSSGEESSAAPSSSTVSVSRSSSGRPSSSGSSSSALLSDSVSSSSESSSSAIPSMTALSPLAPTANTAYAANAYTLWKGYHFATLESETSVYPSLAADFGDVFTAAYMPAARVVWAAQSSGYYKNQCSVDDAAATTMKFRACTVSEGVGLGMLLAYFNGDDDAFVQLWNYARAYRAYENDGLMPQIVESFHWNVVDDASAAGADQDIATALILMYFKTSHAAYLQDALTIVNAIWDGEVDQTTKLLLPGDADAWKGDNPVHSLGRFSPMALRLFARIDPSHDWQGVLDAMYAYLQLVQSKGTGVLPNWSDEDGNAAKPPEQPKDYYLFGDEALAVPWRVAWDWHWTLDSRAGAVLNALNAFITGESQNDPESSALATAYSWNADVGPNKAGSVVQHQQYGAWCATGMAVNVTWLSACTTGLNAKQPSNNTTSYFPDIMLAIHSALLNGLFVPPAGL